MDGDEVFETVKALLVEHLGVPEDDVTRDATFKGTFEADSLDLVELVMEMEDRFGIAITDEEARRLLSVGDVVEFVTERAP